MSPLNVYHCHQFDDLKMRVSIFYAKMQRDSFYYDLNLNLLKILFLNKNRCDIDEIYQFKIFWSRIFNLKLIRESQLNNHDDEIYKNDEYAINYFDSNNQ
jgi:hypothetical protein